MPYNLKIPITAFFLIFILSFYAVAQDSVKMKKWNLKGYVSEMPSVIFYNANGGGIYDNVLHNRLNFSWSPVQSINTEVDFRNRYISGDRFNLFQGYKELFNKEAGAVDVTENIFSTKSSVLNCSVDRAFVKVTKDKFDITAGRQRINWGQAFVWNPNDLFNAYSFFDLDYSEKKGSDALRVQYYPSAVSVVETAVKLDSSGKITGGALWKFNKWNTDFQLIGGMIDATDYAVGLGWSGNVKSVSLRGEVSYFRPKNNFEDTMGVFVACVAAEYSFPNQAFLQVEFLYNQLSQEMQNFNILQFTNTNLSPKALSFSEYNIFVQFSYPVTPLVKVSIAGIYYPKIKGFFAAPSVDISVYNNIDLSLMIQGFSAENAQVVSSEIKRFGLAMGYLRLKWNF